MRMLEVACGAAANGAGGCEISRLIAEHGPEGYGDLRQLIAHDCKWMQKPSADIYDRCGLRFGAARASFGFGPPGVLPADAWYCSEHREDGERAWVARYGMRPTGAGDGRLV